MTSWQDVIEQDLLSNPNVKDAAILGLAQGPQQPASFWASSGIFSNLDENTISTLSQLMTMEDEEDEDAIYDTKLTLVCSASGGSANGQQGKDKGSSLEGKPWFITNVSRQQQTSNASITFPLEMFAKNGLDGLIFVRSALAAVVVLYSAEHQPGEALCAAERTASFLVESGL